MPERVIEISAEDATFDPIVIKCLGREFRVDGPISVEMLQPVGDDEPITERLAALFGVEEAEFTGMDVRVLTLIANAAMQELIKQIQGKVANPTAPSGISSPKS